MPEPVGLERYQRTEGGLPVIGLEAWARSVEGAEPTRTEGGTDLGLIVRHFGPPVIKAVDTVAKRITIVGGSSAVDRYRDRIIVQGYDLRQFVRNPQVPWCHEYWRLPIAAGVDPRIEGDDFVLEFDFSVTSRVDPFANMAWELYAAKVLRAASVGGMPETWVVDETRRGMDVTRFALWETSGCLIGVNHDALAKAKLNGIEASPMDAWARQVLDEGGSVFLPKARAEALVKALGYGKGLTLFELDPEAIEGLRRSPNEITLKIGADIDPAVEAIFALAAKAADGKATAAAIAEAFMAIDAALAKAEPIKEAEKPKPHRKGEDEPEEEPEPEEKAAEAEPVQECGGEDDDEIELDLEAIAADVGTEEEEADDEEIEYDEDELEEALAAVMAEALRDKPSTPAHPGRS